MAPAEEGAMKNDWSNDEVIAAFSAWRSQFTGGTLKNGAPLVSAERVETEIAAVREFARFIEPKLLAESTVVDINAFERQLPRGPRPTVMGIELFRTSGRTS